MTQHYTITQNISLLVLCVEAIKILSCHFAPHNNTIFNTTKYGNVNTDKYLVCLHRKLVAYLYEKNTLVVLMYSNFK